MSEQQAPNKYTLVEEGTELTGTIRSTVPIVVMGKVEGEITGPAIQVAASGVVAGKVTVKHLQSEGEIAGEVEAEAVKISGRVRDRTVIRAKSIDVAVVSNGMQVQFGDCELQIGEAPDKEAAIAAAAAAGAAPTAVPLATGTMPVDPAARKGDRKARPSEMWEEGAKKPAAEPAAAAAPADEEPKRKAKTQPPPVG